MKKWGGAIEHGRERGRGKGEDEKENRKLVGRGQEERTSRKCTVMEHCCIFLTPRL